jgi:hypothetical protein
MGLYNTTSSIYSSASGVYNTANGTGSVAFGKSNYTSGNYSVGVGTNNNSTALRASALGLANTASGYYSTASGYYSHSVGLKSSSFGAINNSYGPFSTTIGYQNTTSLYQGYYSPGSGWGASAFGYKNYAQASQTSAFGHKNHANHRQASAFGSQNTASHYYAVAFGVENTASGYASTVFGVWSSASGHYATGIGNTAVARCDRTVVLGGPILTRGDVNDIDLNYKQLIVQNFSGTNNVIMTQNIDLTAVADIWLPMPDGTSFYCDEVGVIISHADTVASQPTVHFGFGTQKNEIVHIQFSTVPASGHWNITIFGRSTDDLLSSSSASDIQAALNYAANGGDSHQLKGRFIVTGNYTSGFSVEYRGDFQDTQYSNLSATANGLYDSNPTAVTINVTESQAGGPTITPAGLLAAVSTSGLAAVNARYRATSLLDYNGHKVISAGVTVGAGATSLVGRFYWKGILVEDSQASAH